MSLNSLQSRIKYFAPVILLINIFLMFLRYWLGFALPYFVQIYPSIQFSVPNYFNGVIAIFQMLITFIAVITSLVYCFSGNQQNKPFKYSWLGISTASFILSLNPLIFAVIAKILHSI